MAASDITLHGLEEASRRFSLMLASVPESALPLFRKALFSSALDQKKKAIRGSRLSARAKRRLSAGTVRGALRIYQDGKTIDTLKTSVASYWPAFAALRDGANIRPKKARMLRIPLTRRRVRPVKSAPMFTLELNGEVYLARKRTRGKRSGELEVLAKLERQVSIEPMIPWEETFRSITVPKLMERFSGVLDKVLREAKL
jgi:hypothetical protein